MKKKAFSYLELIISMGLVVMVVFLTTPFLVHLSKTSGARFGEYRAYAKYIANLDDIDPEYRANLSPCYDRGSGESDHWVLFENTKRATSDYTEDDKPCICDSENKRQVCVFTLPNHVVDYKVQLYGAGGSGSKAFFDDEMSNPDEFNIIRGSGGKSGQYITRQDNLSRAVASDDSAELRIYKCSDIIDKYGFSTVNNAKINCVGTTIQDTSEFSNRYVSMMRANIVKRFVYNKFDDNLYNNAMTYFGTTSDVANEFKKAKQNQSSHNDIKLYLENNADQLDQGPNLTLPESYKDYAQFGGDSYFQFDDSNEPTFAAGGEGGFTHKNFSEQLFVSDIDDQVNTKDFYKAPNGSYVFAGKNGVGFGNTVGGAGGDCLDLNNSFNDEFCVGSTPVVAGCSNTNNKLIPCPDNNSIIKSYNFGAGGGGCALKIKESQTSNSGFEQDFDNCEGARGAGGAVVIEWN